MPQTNDKEIKTLEKRIKALRRRLMTLWDTHGYTTPTVLAASIELDELMNEYEKRRKAIGVRQ